MSIMWCGVVLLVRLGITRNTGQHGGDLAFRRAFKTGRQFTKKCMVVKLKSVKYGGIQCLGHFAVFSIGL